MVDLLSTSVLFAVKEQKFFQKNDVVNSGHYACMATCYNTSGQCMNFPLTNILRADKAMTHYTASKDWNKIRHY